MNCIRSYCQANGLEYQVVTENGISVNVIKRIARDILAGESMEKMLITSIGYNSKLGLDFIVAQLKIFQLNNNKVPLSTDKDMSPAVRGLSHKYWEKFGVKSWNDLLIYTFGEDQLEEWKELERKQRFDQAIKELREFYQKNQRLPIKKDKECRTIDNTIITGYWENYGIKTWNDMLFYVFGEGSLDKSKYSSPNGLKQAIQELKEFYKKQGKLSI
ncbi:MAG: hypothetical protein ACTSR8_15640 [Promethearchaeota archaeon]